MRQVVDVGGPRLIHPSQRLSAAGRRASPPSRLGSASPATLLHLGSFSRIHQETATAELPASSCLFSTLITSADGIPSFFSFGPQVDPILILLMQSQRSLDPGLYGPTRSPDDAL